MQPKTDRACAGFPDVVYTKLANVFDYPLDEDPQTHQPIPQDPNKPYLSEHAKLLYSYLAQGKTIDQAVEAASTQWRPSHRIVSNNYAQYVRMDMLVKGDHNARLISVYTGNTAQLSPDAPPERPASELLPGYYPYRWYLVNP